MAAKSKIKGRPSDLKQLVGMVMVGQRMEHVYVESAKKTAEKAAAAAVEKPNWIKIQALRLFINERAREKQEQKVKDRESIDMRKDLRSLQRQRELLNKRTVPGLNNQERWGRCLTADAEDMKKNLSPATSGYYTRQEKRDVTKIFQHLVALDQHKEAIRLARQEIEWLTNDIRDVEDEIRETRRLIAERKLQCSTLRGTASKALNREEKLTKDFGAQITENRRLMAEIHHLCLERAVVLKTHREIEREVCELSKQLADHVKATSTTYDSRNVARLNTAKLRHTYERTTVAFLSDMAELDAQIDAFKGTEKFMLTKDKYLSDKGAERRALLKQQATPSEKDTRLLRDTAKTVAATLSKRDMNEVVDTVLEMVGQNYMLVSNVSESLSKNRALQIQISETKQQIRAIRAGHARQGREVRKRRAELKEKKEIYRKILEPWQVKVDQADSVIEKYGRAVTETLKKLGYTDGDIRRVAGVYKVAESRNIMVFLKELECFVNKLWGLQEYREFVDYRTLCRKIPVQPPPQPLAARTKRPRVAVVAPTWVTEEEGDSAFSKIADVKPLTLEEMLSVVENDLNSRKPARKRAISLDVPSMIRVISEEQIDQPEPPTGPVMIDVF